MTPGILLKEPKEQEMWRRKNRPQVTLIIDNRTTSQCIQDAPLWDGVIRLCTVKGFRKDEKQGERQTTVELKAQTKFSPLIRRIIYKHSQLQFWRVCSNERTLKACVGFLQDGGSIFEENYAKRIPPSWYFYSELIQYWGLGVTYGQASLLVK